MAGGRKPLQELWARAESSWDMILGEEGVNGTTLVVCHGALGRVMIGSAFGMDISMFRDGRFALENCALIELIFDGSCGVKWRRLRPEEGEFEKSKTSEVF